MRKEIILASNSPRRIYLLGQIGIDFKVVSPNVEEEGNSERRSPVDIVKSNALKKVQKVAEEYRNAIIIGADTVVVLDGEIIGKPKDERDAIRILKRLRDRYHFVFSGVAVMETPEEKVLTSVVRSKVKMRDYSDEEIERYVATGEPMDKAGAYGIQGKGALLVEKIEGDYYNIVGLPLVRLNSLLNRFGYSLL
ncbi:MULTISPECIES: Maf family protein [Dictyoglomus]|jgi:septum formation protein|uniref:dTTP/UTP pyrophosphatase n=1 Tax=Dictyoglomus turgidum (strain DSM 6724 / Z-1310) TaxID=515635 RepID=NTPPA_DICTD|nr:MULTISPECIES: Maf family protein [Dictyoglomus]B8E0U2.1 RecName: Full=dTTP/UTP pyrophosphatase; Short=dTTPase/UTPase; AltName: Full=Nucleoside triphosphate pyrophosphatase; AltName: Full=Nucleotide pyrophosphatase; Short=Nucleotide PPase [Dictyoglomus turgidum DSM 6724]ACK42679.1 maf protein [Dictyoglomus turgidum DSM 6724]PNV78804.1 MAG: maf-like protein [Dictyoglomus turgidum]HBU30738.1 septum formation inhibitor Maf [Dictyoglomus sp.]